MTSGLDTLDNDGENEDMKTSTALAFAGICALTLVVWTSTSPASATVAAGETITGRLVESGCAAMGSAEPSDEHVACMVRCAKDGDPIGILTDDGIVTITGDWAATHPDDLTRMMAKQVRATGQTSRAGGAMVLHVATIELAP
jgi:hypothetical protein